MEQKKTLCVGLDLCSDFSQLYCYNEKTFEPEAVEKNPGDGPVPTVLAVREDTKEWLYGAEAREAASGGRAVLVGDILEKTGRQEEFVIYGQSFSGVQVLEKFLRRILSLLKIYSPNESIRKLSVAVPDMDMQVIRSIYKALERMGILKDRARVISHEQAYLYYALSQKKELWMNDIGLFDFSKKGLTYHQITINRKSTPMLVGVTHKDFTETLSYDLLQEQGENGGVDYIFENIAKSVLHRQIVSTIYITGAGFEGEWASGVFKELCAGRRLFVGQNLYGKGACHAAREHALAEEGEGRGRLEDFILLSEEMVPCTITTKVYHDAAVGELVLIRAGTPWYEATVRFSVIPDSEEEMEFTVTNLIKKSAQSHMIHLGEIGERSPRTSRLDVHVYFTDIKTCVISIKDRGFGSLFPTSNRIWEKTISI